MKYIKHTQRYFALCLLTALCLSCSGCWGGGAWMAQMLGLAIWGGRVHQTQKEQQKVLNAQIIRKYEIENKKRAKASKPPLKVPEQPQTAKRTLWY